MTWRATSDPRYRKAETAEPTNPEDTLEVGDNFPERIESTEHLGDFTHWCWGYGWHALPFYPKDAGGSGVRGGGGVGGGGNRLPYCAGLQILSDDRVKDLGDVRGLPREVGNGDAGAAPGGGDGGGDTPGFGSGAGVGAGAGAAGAGAAGAAGAEGAGAAGHKPWETPVEVARRRQGHLTIFFPAGTSTRFPMTRDHMSYSA